MRLKTYAVSILVTLLIGVMAAGFFTQRGQGVEPPATEWMQTYGGANSDIARSVVQTSDGGYLLAGDTMSLGAGDLDFWLVKVDSAGNHEWNKTYGGPRPDVAHAITQTTDGGYALAGFTESFGAAGQDLWLVKTDIAGNLEWRIRYGGAGDEDARAVIETSDGGYALAGFTTSFGAGGEDFWLIKVSGPPEYILTIHSNPTGITVMVGSLSFPTPWNGTFQGGISVSFEAPEVHIQGDAKYYWNQWSDGNTSRSRTITMTANITLTALFTGPYYELSINSSPTIGVPFSINGIPHSTQYSAWLVQNSYTIEMPQESNGYVWSHWLEDGDTNRIKTVVLQTRATYTAVYAIPVGGITVGIESGHLGCWMASVSAIMIAFAASRIHLKDEAAD